MKSVAIALMCLLVAGCAKSTTIDPQAQVDIAKAVEACKPPATDSITEFAVCTSSAEDRIYRRYGASPDLLGYTAEKNQETIRQAKRVDAGEISYEEAVVNVDAWIAKADANIAAQQRERERQAWRDYMAFQQNQQAIQSSQPTYQIPTPVQTRCQRIGDFMNCTTQ